MKYCHRSSHAGLKMKIHTKNLSQTTHAPTALPYNITTVAHSSYMHIYPIRGLSGRPLLHSCFILAFLSSMSCLSFYWRASLACSQSQILICLFFHWLTFISGFSERSYWSMPQKQALNQAIPLPSISQWPTEQLLQRSEPRLGLG